MNRITMSVSLVCLLFAGIFVLKPNAWSGNSDLAAAKLVEDVRPFIAPDFEKLGEQNQQKCLEFGAAYAAWDLVSEKLKADQREYDHISTMPIEQYIQEHIKDPVRRAKLASNHVQANLIRDRHLLILKRSIGEIKEQEDASSALLSNTITNSHISNPEACPTGQAYTDALRKNLPPSTTWVVGGISGGMGNDNDGTLSIVVGH